MPGQRCGGFPRPVHVGGGYERLSLRRRRLSRVVPVRPRRLGPLHGPPVRASPGPLRPPCARPPAFGPGPATTGPRPGGRRAVRAVSACGRPRRRRPAAGAPTGRTRKRPAPGLAIGRIGARQCRREAAAGEAAAGGPLVRSGPGPGEAGGPDGRRPERRGASPAGGAHPDGTGVERTWSRCLCRRLRAGGDVRGRHGAGGGALDELSSHELTRWWRRLTAGRLRRRPGRLARGGPGMARGRPGPALSPRRLGSRPGGRDRASGPGTAPARDRRVGQASSARGRKRAVGALPARRHSRLLAGEPRLPGCFARGPAPAGVLFVAGTLEDSGGTPSRGHSRYPQVHPRGSRRFLPARL